MGRSFRESLYRDRPRSHRDGEDKHLLHRHDRRRDRQELEDLDDEPTSSKSKDSRKDHLDSDDD
ncbi:MAG: hypothetical protein KDD47_14320 [Acidobacteria bacterium]|nr:hypothetical protein [Acidobacteriota bacterium]